MGSVVKMLGFTTLTCGCVVGRYRELASSREFAYVEAKGAGCSTHRHRRNHTVAPPQEESQAPQREQRAS